MHRAPWKRAWLGRDALWVGTWALYPGLAGLKAHSLWWCIVVCYRVPQQMLPPTLTPGLGENSRSQVSLDLALSLR